MKDITSFENEDKGFKEEGNKNLENEIKKE